MYWINNKVVTSSSYKLSIFLISTKPLNNSEQFLKEIKP